MRERLQKLLSAAGVCSRRSAEAYIAAGRVTINGVTAGLGDKADMETDDIRVDGARLETREKLWLMLYKPRGYVTTLADEKGRRTAAQLVAGCGGHVWPVGRLDMDSEGLLLFTNDGGGTYRLTHPGHEVEKEYHVSVEGDLDGALPVLSGVMHLDGKRLAPAKVKVLRRSSAGGVLSIVIHQGLNRQIRRMCALAGLKVTRLVRVREGTLELGDLRSGAWRRLTDGEVDRLLK